jgi:hypothetical protein
MKSWNAAAVALLIPSTPAFSAVKVGEAVLVQTTVSGGSGKLVAKSPVHRDERIRTSATGLGEFVFRDGTKFAVGGNSSVVIDNFVFNDNKSAQDLTIKIAKGSFRWISGGSKSSAYKIDTPAGTVGIRGTALDFYVGSGGTTAVVLLSGAARFCAKNGCQELKRRCDVIIATPGGGYRRPNALTEASLVNCATAARCHFSPATKNCPADSGFDEMAASWRLRSMACRQAPRQD